MSVATMRQRMSKVRLGQRGDNKMSTLWWCVVRKLNMPKINTLDIVTLIKYFKGHCLFSNTKY